MKRRIIALAFTLALGLSAFAFYSSSRSEVSRVPTDSSLKPFQEASVASKESTKNSASVSPQDRNARVPPPPPTEPLTKAAVEPEPNRMRVGVTNEKLEQIQSVLPPGAEVYFSPVGDKEALAAIVDADLNGDGRAESIVVYTPGSQKASEENPTLTLSVLKANGTGYSVLSSVSLYGGVLFNIEDSGHLSPLLVRKITGRNDVLVASGIGASLGGELQVFALEGYELRPLLKSGGHYFKVEERPGQGWLIVTGSRYDTEHPSRFEWKNGQFVDYK